MVNPFEDITPETAAAGPNFSHIFGEATEAAKASVLSEAVGMSKTAHTIAQQAKQAHKSGNMAWLGKLHEYANRLKDMLVEFIKKAIELAVFKLVLELCAMIMNSIVDALSRRGNQRMEITTPGVYLQPKAATAGSSSQPAGATSSGYAARSTNPFDYRSNSDISPW